MDTLLLIPVAVIILSLIMGLCRRCSKRVAEQQFALMLEVRSHTARAQKGLR